MIKNSVVDVYARTLFEIAQEEAITNEILYQLISMQEKITNEFSEFFAGELIPVDEKIAVAEHFADSGMNPMIINVIKNLVTRHQMKYFEGIIFQFKELCQKQEKIKIVNVKSARPLSDSNFRYVWEQLEQQLDAFVVIKPTIEPNLIGGIAIEYEGKQIDNTIKKHLRDLQSQTLGV